MSQISLLAKGSSDSSPSLVQIQDNKSGADVARGLAPSVTGVNESADFDLIPYIDRGNDIAMLYPSDWIASTSGLSYPGLIAFYSPLENLSDFLPPAQLVLSLTRYQENISLSDYTNQTLTGLFDLALRPQVGPPGQKMQNMTQLQAEELSQNQTQPSINIQSSDPITVSGYHAHRVVFFVGPSQNNPFNIGVMQIWILVDANKLYTMTYSAEDTNFVKFLPNLSQMLNSTIIS